MTGTGRAGSLDLQRRRLFVLRRACWYGRVVIKDIQDAFGVTRQVAGKDLVDAVEHWTWIDEKGGVHPVLFKGTRAVQPTHQLHCQNLPQCSPATMFALLTAKAGFQETGLQPSEIRVLFPGGGLSKPDARIAEVLLRALINREEQGLPPRVVAIRYVGLKQGDVYRERTVVPVALEFDGAQTRMYAQDLEAEGWPIKAFVLSRIEHAELRETPLPKAFIARDVSSLRRVRFRLTLDPRLTEDQRSAIAREMGMNAAGVVEVDASYAHAFKRFYTNGVPSDATADIVWPPVIFTEET